MEIQLRDMGRHKVIAIEGDVDLYNVSELKQSIFKMLDDENIQSLIVDMKDINYMDSSGIGALVAAQKKVKTLGGKFALLNVRDEVINILRLATLDQFFTIYEDDSKVEQ
ncbi:MAG: STAS domain-containing protein [Spirochaetia bacterium]|nr:STAS domain-containing protein [Spirochaetia bacterium]